MILTNALIISKVVETSSYIYIYFQPRRTISVACIRMQAAAQREEMHCERGGTRFQKFKKKHWTAINIFSTSYRLRSGSDWFTKLNRQQQVNTPIGRQDISVFFEFVHTCVFFRSSTITTTSKSKKIKTWLLKKTYIAVIPAKIVTFFEECAWQSWVQTKHTFNL